MKKSIIAAALAVLLLSGCGGVDKSPEAVKGVVTEMLLAVKTYDTDKINSFLSDKNVKLAMPEANLGSYKIIDQKVEGDIAHITLELVIDNNNPLKSMEGHSSHVIWVLKATDDGWKYVDYEIKPRYNDKRI